MTESLELAVLYDVVSRLEAAGFDYMLTGTAHGRKMLNLVHFESVVKVDLIVRKKSVYRQLEFDRRQQIHVGELVT